MNIGVLWSVSVGLIVVICVDVRLIDRIDVLLMKEDQKQEEVKQILILTDRSYQLQRLASGSLRKEARVRGIQHDRRVTYASRIYPDELRKEGSPN